MVEFEQNNMNMLVEAYDGIRNDENVGEQENENGDEEESGIFNIPVVTPIDNTANIE